VFVRCNLRLREGNWRALRSLSCTPSPTSRARDSTGQGADERAELAYEYVEPIRFEIYRSAGEQIVAGMRAEAAAAGATLTLWPEFVTGFLRLAPG